MDDEVLASIVEFQDRNGYNAPRLSTFILISLISDDREFIRTVILGAMEPVADNPFILYQVHRASLWIGDIDGASRLVPALQSSELPEDSRQMVMLRQACAENRVSDARQIFEYFRVLPEDEFSFRWLTNKVMDNEEAALEVMRELDAKQELLMLSDFLSYAHFDAHPLPNLMRQLESQGVTPREPRDVPYRCRF